MRKSWIPDAALGAPLRTLSVATLLVAAMFAAMFAMVFAVVLVGPDPAGAAAVACSAPDGAPQVAADGGGCWLAEGPPVPGPGRTLAAPAVASEAPIVPGAPVVPVAPGGPTSSTSGLVHPPAGGVPFTELLGGGVAALVTAIAVVGLWPRPTRARRLTSR